MDSDHRLSEHVLGKKKAFFGENKYKPIGREDLIGFLCEHWLKIHKCRHIENAATREAIEAKYRDGMMTYEVFVMWTNEFLIKGKFL